jgi:hypothetical protein
MTVIRQIPLSTPSDWVGGFRLCKALPGRWANLILLDAYNNEPIKPLLRALVPMVNQQYLSGNKEIFKRYAFKGSGFIVLDSGLASAGYMISRGR